jgi:hypothetical protein
LYQPLTYPHQLSDQKLYDYVQRETNGDAVPVTWAAANIMCKHFDAHGRPWRGKILRLVGNDPSHEPPIVMDEPGMYCIYWVCGQWRATQLRRTIEVDRKYVLVMNASY